MRKVDLNSDQALLVIDAQANMFDPKRPVWSANELLDRLTKLADQARLAHTPVVWVRNCGDEGDPDVRGTAGWELHPALQPATDDLVLDKTTCDTFASTALQDELDKLGVKRVIIAGLQSDYCIRETTLGALARGFEVTLVADGHSTYDGESKSAAEISAAVNSEFKARVTLLSAEAVRFSSSR